MSTAAAGVAASASLSAALFLRINRRLQRLRNEHRHGEQQRAKQHPINLLVAAPHLASTPGGLQADGTVTPTEVCYAI